VKYSIYRYNICHFLYCFYAASNYLRDKKSQGAFYSSAFIVLRFSEMKHADLKEQYLDGMASNEIMYEGNATALKCHRGTYLFIKLILLHK